MFHKRTTPKIFAYAKALRRNQTPAEAKLWSRLRNHQLNGIGFRRQHAIGDYIGDFCAPRQKLIIEVDGNPHREEKDYDSERTENLKAQGYLVLRFWNSEVMNNVEAVLQTILKALESHNQTSKKG